MKQSITKFAGFLCCLALLLPLLALPVAGCGGKNGDSKSPDADDSEQSDKVVTSKGKKWGGWRWKGKRDDCFFVVKNKCFNNQRAACKAAGCTKESCTHDRSAPAKVSCKADD